MAPEELKDTLDFIISLCQQKQKIEIQLNFRRSLLVKAITTCPELAEAEGQNELPVYYCMHADLASIGGLRGTDLLHAERVVR